MDDSALLDFVPDELKQKLLLSKNDSKLNDPNDLNEFHNKLVVPQPGFCIKTKNENNEKVFINVCYCDEIPKPKDISDEEIIKLLDSQDPSSFRVPLSFGEPHTETDNSGKGCTAYDVLVNTEFIKLLEREILKGFFFTLTFEGLEEKYKISLNRNATILKNKKFLGTIQPHRIRTQAKPWIMEMEDDLINKNVNNFHNEKGDKPEFVITKHPPEGETDFLIAKINLPKIMSAESLNLEIGEDRIVLETRSLVYHLDIFLPFLFIQSEVDALFDKNKRVLEIKMPVLK